VKEQLYDSFCNAFPDKKNYITQNSITINFKKYCEYKGYICSTNRNGGSTRLSFVQEVKEIDIWDELTIKAMNI
jgi:hypothetical protein